VILSRDPQEERGDRWLGSQVEAASDKRLNNRRNVGLRCVSQRKVDVTVVEDDLCCLTVLLRKDRPQSFVPPDDII